MRIGIDGNEANVEKRVGVSVYTHELLRYFQSQATIETQFRVYLRTDKRDDLPNETEFFQYEVVKSPVFWRDIFLPIRLYAGKRQDVFFSPAHYTPRFCPISVVVTIHDVAYEYYPDEFLKTDLYKLKNWTQHAINQAQKIIAVSQNTKKDIVKFYRVPEDKIEVIYNGFSKKVSSIKYQVSRIKDNTKYSILNTKYLLYVGTLQPRKNVTTLIDSYYQLINSNVQFSEYKLVIVGKKGWRFEDIFAKVKELSLEKNVIFTGYVADNELAALYQNAACFILPSLYEGFGIPILEAMSYNCPVIAAQTSSLPEIGGDACLYFDPHDTIDLRDKMKKIVEDRELREDLIKKGKERIKQFSWEKCGRETLNTLINSSHLVSKAHPESRSWTSQDDQ